MPENTRELLRLRHWEELPIAEIAQVLGITVTSARVRLHRARARLHALLTMPLPEEGR